MRAVRSESLNLMCAVSTAKGELYFATSSGRMVPEPKQETYSAVASVSASMGPTQCVAYHMGGRPGQ